MRNIVSARPTAPPYMHAVAMLPFALPFLLTFALVLFVGEQWPRDIALGSGLKLAGLFCAAVTACVVWLYAVRDVTDTRIRTFAAILCGVAGLLSWPVWSTGVLPSVNGAVLSEPVVVPMTLERTDTSHKSKSRGVYHWAWLRTQEEDAVIKSGRYLISEDTYERYNGAEGDIVRVSVARGLLGAQVVIGQD